MNHSAISAEDLNQMTNKIRDACGILSVAGVSILTIYGLVKMTPVWKKSGPEEQTHPSSTAVKS